MAIPLQEFCDTCDALLEASFFSDYCPNGLQVEGKKEVNRVATGVSASLEVIEKAVEWGADVLFVHHGLFWNRDSYVITGTKRKKIALLLQHGISLVAYHLPLDAHREWGNNWKAAQDLDWKHLEPFGDLNGMSIGVKGRFSPVPIVAFQKRLEEYYDHTAHCALAGPKEVRSAALISGGAHREIEQAVAAGVDAFITGSFDEPVWNIAWEEKIHFLALGHSNTERVGPKAMQAFFAENFAAETVFLDVENFF